MQERLRLIKEEEERFKKAEEEKIRLAEEAEKLREEEVCGFIYRFNFVSLFSSVFVYTAI